MELVNVKFAGRACFGDLGGQNRAKLQFTTISHADQYSALAVDILNRTDGKVDSLLFHFKDIWGSKPVSNPNFKDGVKPYIWTSGVKNDWYVYKPSPRDFEVLADSVNNYLSVFVDRDTVREQDRSAFNNALNRGKQKSGAYKTQNPKNHGKTNKKDKEAIE
ncbi:MAG: hypothetical protein LBR83_01815 [Clostridiales bacterium]|jgi:hypothetical protein|nr:hypothetical protein [Clostridiales bacterium]